MVKSMSQPFWVEHMTPGLLHKHAPIYSLQPTATRKRIDCQAESFPFRDDQHSGLELYQCYRHVELWVQIMKYLPLGISLPNLRLLNDWCWKIYLAVRPVYCISITCSRSLGTLFVYFAVISLPDQDKWYL